MSHSRTHVVLVLLAGLSACGKDCGCGGEAPLAAPTPAALAPTQPPAPEPQPESTVPPMPTVPSPHPVGYPKEGWSKVVIDDQVPLCLFPDYQAHYEAKFLKDVTKQTLKANATLVVGAFGPYCINEACDDLPSLQCEAALEGDVIVVKTHYWAYHKDGSSCAGQTCRQVTAGCQTPELPAGKYTIKHGAKNYPLKIPATLAKPCFGSELTPPASN